MAKLSPVASPEVNGNVAAINELEVPVVLKLSLPPDLYAEYKDLADKQGLTPAELIQHRLRRCAGHSSIRSLYFSESQLRQLETVLQKRPIETTEQAITSIISLLSIQVAGFEPVPITAHQAKRIKLGAYGGNSPQDHLHNIVTGAVARATGT